MPATLRRATTVLTALAMLALLAGPASAQSARTFDTTRLLGGLAQQQLRIDLGGGDIARGQVLRLPEDANRLSLEPHSAGGTLAGTEPMRRIARRQFDEGAVAGVNGGFGLNRPSGVPNGLYVEDGELLSGGSAVGSGWELEGGRGAFGLMPTGRAIFDRVDHRLTLTGPDGTAVEIHELNREPRIGEGSNPHPVPTPEGEDESRRQYEVVLLTPRFGADVPIQADSRVLRLDATELVSGRTTTTTVRTSVVGGPAVVTVPADGAMLVAHGEVPDDVADAIDAIEAGDRLELESVPRPMATDASNWEELTQALPGGPLLLRDGQELGLSSWREEKFSEATLTARQPRTAIARTGEGRLLLVTVDGRQEDWSVGVTLAELTSVLQQLGARDALNLDGGGSTAMAVGGEITNRPSDPDRHLDNALFVYAPLPGDARDTTDGACEPDQVVAPGFDDTANSAFFAAIDCLASLGITEGVEPDHYRTGRDVSREQMASFVARTIDAAAEGGSGLAELPEPGSWDFEDVPEGSVHAEAIARLAEAGVVQGTSATTYAPNRAVTRAEMATFLDRAYRFLTGRRLPNEPDTFIGDSESTHEEAIDRLAGVGIVEGIEGFIYGPEQAVNRAQMSAFVTRSVDVLVDDGDTTPRHG